MLTSNVAVPSVGKQRRDKGKREIVWRSLFGKLRIHSPRLYTCSCQSQRDEEFQSIGYFTAGTECARITLSPDKVGIFDVLRV